MRMLWLVLALAALGCRSAEQTALRVDPALAALVSSDVVLLAGVKMDALRATPVYKTWVSGMAQPFLDSLADRLGLDPRKDLWELLIASDGKQTLIMARGKFGPMGMEPKIGRQGAQRTPYKGYTLIGDERSALVFMNSSTAAAGPAPALRTLIDRRNRGGSPSSLLGRVRTLPAGNQIWAVTSSAAAFAHEVPASGNWAGLRKIVEMLGASTAVADLRSGLKLAATGLCRNEKDARTLSDALRGLIGLARLTNPDNQPELLRAYDGIRVEQNRQTVSFTAEIPQELLDLLIARFRQGGLPGATRRQPAR